jgi:hypothetical protein
MAGRTGGNGPRKPVRGGGHANLLLIKDFANPKQMIFRAETEVFLTSDAQFNSLRKWLDKRRSNNKKIEELLHRRVDAFGTSSKDRRTAKNIFSAALDLPVKK